MTDGALRYVALLRGINVGGHTVKMTRLRELFEGMGLSGARSFIASGNIVFDSGEVDMPALERRIEAGLRVGLGYEAATFLRTSAQIAAIGAAEPFADQPAAEADSRYVIFLRSAPDDATRDRLLALSNPRDLLHLDGPDLHWLRRGSLLASTITDVDLRRALGPLAVNTVRNLNTVRRLAATYGSPPA